MFRFRQFEVSDTRSAMKIGTDGVLLGAWAPLPPGSQQPGEIWDIGTGTGLLALMMAQRSATSHITAIEISHAAYLDATDNAGASPWNDRITVVCDDILKAAPTLPTPDLIISNPPFFNESLHSPIAERSMARHEGALNPISLLELAARFLKPSGALACIIPYSRLDETEYRASLLKFTPTHLCPVVSRESNKPIRLLARFVKDISPVPVERTIITIRDTDNNYTSQYRDLTSPFYLHLK